MTTHRGRGAELTPNSSVRWSNVTLVGTAVFLLNLVGFVSFAIDCDLDLGQTSFKQEVCDLAPDSYGAYVLPVGGLTAMVVASGAMAHGGGRWLITLYRLVSSFALLLGIGLILAFGVL